MDTLLADIYGKKGFSSVQCGVGDSRSKYSETGKYGNYVENINDLYQQEKR